jgi:hypothetical protein
MTAVYLLVIFAPLAPAALHAKIVLYAVTGECSGDCHVCGCAAERSAARTCCCWQKKLLQQRTALTRESRNCCQQQGLRHDHAEHDEESAATASSGAGSQLTAIAPCPCSSDKHAALQGLEDVQHYPFIYAASIPAAHSLPLIPLSPDRLTSRDREPPVPPPRVAISA